MTAIELRPCQTKPWGWTARRPAWPQCPCSRRFRSSKGRFRWSLPFSHSKSTRMNAGRRRAGRRDRVPRPRRQAVIRRSQAPPRPCKGTVYKSFPGSASRFERAKKYCCETRRTVPCSSYATAPKPSYFTSKIQSGWSKDASSSARGMGMSLGIGENCQFSRAARSRACGRNGAQFAHI